jgi:rhodanese-related sulfurtransferase
MKRHITWILTLALVLAALPATGSGDVMMMNVDTLKNQLGNDDVVVLDVRTGRDWSSSEFKIKGARRADPKDFDTWSAGLDSQKTIVLYCA